MMRPIDADALKEELCKEYCHFDQRIKISTVFQLIRDAPTIEPEREKGKWIVVDDAYNRISGKCSVCGWEAHMYEDDVVGMDYCPNCGARMEDKE